MKTIKKPLQESEINNVLDNFNNTFESEFKDELFATEPNVLDDGFCELNDFYSDFLIEVGEKEERLQERLNKGVITHEEFEELEAIAVVKYPEIKFEEIADFYLFSYSVTDKIKAYISYTNHKIADLY